MVCTVLRAVSCSRHPNTATKGVDSVNLPVRQLPRPHDTPRVHRTILSNAYRRARRAGQQRCHRERPRRIGNSFSLAQPFGGGGVWWVGFREINRVGEPAGYYHHRARGGGAVGIEESAKEGARGHGCYGACTAWEIVIFVRWNAGERLIPLWLLCLKGTVSRLNSRGR